MKRKVCHDESSNTFLTTIVERVVSGQSVRIFLTPAVSHPVLGGLRTCYSNAYNPIGCFMRTISVIKLFILDTSAFCLETCVANLVRQIADAVLVFVQF